MRFGIVLVWSMMVGGLAAMVAVGQEKDSAGAVDRFTAPVEWKLYKVSVAESSFVMPKLPVKNDLGFDCSEKRASTYHAYANEAVYEFRFYVREPDVKGPCLSKEAFSTALSTRLNELRMVYNPMPISETDGVVNGRKVKIFRWETVRDQVTRWVFMDNFESHWVELSVANRLGVVPETKRFLDSLVPIKSSGSEILSGSPVYLGDSGPIVKPNTQPGKEPVKEGVLLYSKPQALYTDAARNNNVQGQVILDVTFSANGSIGDISILKALPHGLTEQSIAASRRLAFIPARENGVPASTVRKVVYEFSIY